MEKQIILYFDLYTGDKKTSVNKVALNYTKISALTLVVF